MRPGWPFLYTSRPALLLLLRIPKKAGWNVFTIPALLIIGRKAVRTTTMRALFSPPGTTRGIGKHKEKKVPLCELSSFFSPYRLFFFIETQLINTKTFSCSFLILLIIFITCL